MAKNSIQVLAAAIAKKHKITAAQAATFVEAVFDIVTEELKNNNQVKIKGLGTFKVLSVKPRESVNVNTGERVLIEGHDKISFTPDAAMKELVNKPFSQFETVVLQDGVNFENEKEEDFGNDDDAGEIPVAETKVPIADVKTAKSNISETEPIDKTTAKVQDSSAGTSGRHPSSYPDATSELYKDASTSIPENLSNQEEYSPTIEENKKDDEHLVEGIPAEQKEIETKEGVTEVQEKSPKPVLDIQTPSIAYTESVTEEEEGKGALTESIIPATSKEQPSVEYESIEETDTIAGEVATPVLLEEEQAVKATERETADIKTDSSAMEIPTKELQDKEEHSNVDMDDDDDDSSEDRTLWMMLKVIGVVILLIIIFFIGRAIMKNMGAEKQVARQNMEQPASKPVSPRKVEKALPTAPPKTPQASVADEPANNDGNQYLSLSNDPRIRYGAYNIIGIEKVVVLKKGETMASYSKKTLGPGMVGYFQVLNGKNEMGPGDTLKVPKVEYRPQYQNR